MTSDPTTIRLDAILAARMGQSIQLVQGAVAGIRILDNHRFDDALPQIGEMVEAELAFRRR